MAPVLPFIMAGAALLGTVSSIYGAMNASEAEEKNAAMAEEQANQARIAAGQKEKDFRLRAAAALGEEREARAISGVSMAGTPLLTYYENKRKYEEDAQRIKEGGEVEARGYMSQAELHRDQADAAMWSGVFGAGKTLLTGGMDVYGASKTAGMWV